MPNLEAHEYSPLMICQEPNGVPITGSDIFDMLSNDPQIIDNNDMQNEIYRDFEDAFMKVQDVLPTENELNDYFRRVSSTSIRQVEAPIRNGDFNFGQDIVSFFLITQFYSAWVGKAYDRIRERLTHEFDHYAVLHKYGIPAEFHLYIGKIEETGELGDAMGVKPLFPKGMPQSERARIEREAAENPTELSIYDRQLLENRFL